MSWHSLSRPAARMSVATVALALTAGGLTVPAYSSSLPSSPAQNGDSSWADTAYRGAPEVVGSAAGAKTIDGRVFIDRDRDSQADSDELGRPGVVVSNGRDTTRTDADGRYELPVYKNMTVTVTQPSGYTVPVDADNIPQFHYHHLPQGSPTLKYGGIEPTGPLPDQINFGLVKAPAQGKNKQSCVIGGDIQPYDKQEMEYALKGAFADLAKRTDYSSCGSLFIGDIVGDDLSLYPDVRKAARTLNGPARFLPGNHDMDLDAKDSAHSMDTFRASLSPEYYSYDVGKAHVVALNSVEYPAGKSYTGSIDERQMQWLRNDLATVPKNKVVVLAMHIPLLDFADHDLPQHQVAQVKEIYRLIGNREAIALGGHTHSLENLRKGDSVAGWKSVMGVDKLPFNHITAGAISGDWFSGQMDPKGYPKAVQRDGARPGVLTLDLQGTKVKERFTIRGEKDSEQMSLGMNSPRYREWFAKHYTGTKSKGGAEPFADSTTVSKADLDAGTWLTTNFHLGSTGSTVKVSIDGGKPVTAKRTQSMTGEASRVGAKWSDPAATQEQLVHGGSVADRSMHLWRTNLPKGLKAGKHTAEVEATDVHGRTFNKTIDFTIGKAKAVQ
ncbi:calcineurin-like phosphoesterase C-terminal domain-containing protein [Demetria terragena]|uniref:calcineurin-like phosphoesterase C-terminal domain-containing protein n=1 Tax=Demetria terragena TaxID=63959 RepID=UPI000475BCDD|nr:calcineurin-like phosphoesterase family protein [Demetria terragena]